MPVLVEFILKREPGQPPYFSCTGVMGTLSGSLHKQMEEEHPGEYTDAIALHLSDIDGVPMYAVENGYYFLQVARGNIEGEYTYETVAKHLRISVEDANKLQTYNKDQFTQFVEDQKPRWKAEADAAIKKYNL